MQFNKTISTLGVSFLFATIVVPLAGKVNHQSGFASQPVKNLQLQADGAPIPPLPPQARFMLADGAPIPPLPPQVKTLLADGAPIPPLPPQVKTLVADGAPIPPLPPRGGHGKALMADGAPIPPLPPQNV